MDATMVAGLRSESLSASEAVEGASAGASAGATAPVATAVDMAEVVSDQLDGLEVVLSDSIRLVFSCARIGTRHGENRKSENVGRY
ncbi:MAG: hypothetical protein ACKVIN_01765 [Longimicrobiales bacterium]